MNNIKDNQGMISYAFIITVILVFLAGVIFRFSNLSFASLWSDELYSVAAAIDVGKSVGWLDFEPKVIQELTYHDSFITWKAADNTPPLFESILILWAKAFGNSDFSLRALPALLGSLVPIVFYLGASKYLSKGSALLGSMFLAFSPTLIEYSQEVRAYMLSCLLSAIAITQLVKYVLSYHVQGKLSNRYDSWFFVLVLLVLSYSHYTGFFTAGMLAAIYLVFVSFPQKRYFDIAKFLIVPALIAPWMKLSWKAFEFSSKGGYGWRDYNVSDIYGYMLPKLMDFYAPNISIYFSILIFSLVAFSIVNIKEMKLVRIKSILAIALLIVIALLFMYSIYNAMTSKMWHPRYFAVSVPLVAMSLSLFMSDLRGTSQKIGTSGIAVIVFLFFNFSFHGFINPSQKPLKGNYRDAAKSFAEDIDSRTAVVLGGRQNAAFYLHYLYQYSKNINDEIIFDVSYKNDIDEACEKINSNFDTVYMIRHVTYSAMKNDLSQCLKMNFIGTTDFLDISVDKFRYQGK
ncbi:glycosyltransferase family 39 protein [Aeromonas hydrophila]